MIYPKIVRGGNAIPIGDNLFLMKGRKYYVCSVSTYF